MSTLTRVHGKSHGEAALFLCVPLAFSAGSSGWGLRYNQGSNYIPPPYLCPLAVSAGGTILHMPLPKNCDHVAVKERLCSTPEVVHFAGRVNELCLQ